MITYVTGNLFTSPAQVLVNTVNTVGVMGKGIAKEFKKIYPEMFEEYRELCEKKQLDIGSLFLYKTSNKWILNFPTKKHWRSPSRPEYIEKGLQKFAAKYADANVHSIAFPPLGCGNGELDFETQVKPLLEKYLDNLPIDAFIYPGLKDPYTPEHKVPAETREWLRSEPQSLSFREVWDDLREIFSESRRLRTEAKDSEYMAAFDLDNDQLLIQTKTRNRRYSYDELFDFWQQLRNYGFSLRRIAPNGLERDISYLIPIFSQLPYVKPVLVSESYDQLMSKASIGLQYVPTNRIEHRQEILL